MNATLHRPRTGGLTNLIHRTIGAEDLTVCVQVALSVLVALAGEPGGLDCIDEGRVKALEAGDASLTELLRRVIDVLEAEPRREAA